MAACLLAKMMDNPGQMRVLIKESQFQVLLQLMFLLMMKTPGTLPQECRISWQRSVELPATGVWRTTDGGANYQNISNGLLGDTPEIKSAIRIRKIIATKHAGKIRLVIASSNGVFYTNDGNATDPVWTKIMEGEYYDIEYRPTYDHQLFASGDFEAPLMRYNFPTSALDTISDLNLNFVYEVDSANTRRTTIEFCQDVPDQLFVLISECDECANDEQKYSKLYKYNIISNAFITRVL
jgi:hypothetical protein